MNNIARLVVTQLPRAQSFSRFCIAQCWASVENNRIEREQGVMGRQNIFFPFPFRFLLFLALLDNYLKYPDREPSRATVDDAGKLHPNKEI